MSGFTEVAITTAAPQLADLFIEKLREELEANGIVGWEPAEGDLEIILGNALAPLAANAAAVAATLLPAAFRAFGTQLVKVPYNEGAASVASTRWTLTAAAVAADVPYTIEAGTTVEAGNLAFYVQEDTVIEAGHATVTIQVVASERGTQYNGLTGLLFPTNSIDFIQEVTIVGESSGGANQEEDEAYMDRLVGALALQAPRPITAADFAQMAFDAPPGIFTIPAVVGRATAIDGYNAETSTEGNERTVTIFVTDPEGHALTSEARTDIKEWIEGFRELNFVVFVAEASYHKIYVTCEIHVLPGYAAEAVVSNVQAALLAYLNPQSWGNPSAQTTGINSWLNSSAGFNIVRVNKLIGLVESVPGVDYVPAGQMMVGTSASPSGTVDITMSGAAPLPESESATIIVTAV